METKSSGQKLVFFVVCIMKVERPPQCTDLLRVLYRSTPSPCLPLSHPSLCLTEKCQQQGQQLHTHTEADSQGSGLGVGSSGLAQFVDELVLAGWLFCHLFACNLTVPGDA